MTHTQRFLVFLPLACMMTVGRSAAQLPVPDAVVSAGWESYWTATSDPDGSASDALTASPSLAERPRRLSDEAAAARLASAADPRSERLTLPAALPGDTIVPWPWGWMARGLVGGLVAGPIGAAVAYNMIGRSDAESALDERIRSRRKEAVVVGGMLGTAVLAILLLRVVDLDGTSQGNGGGPVPEPA